MGMTKLTDVELLEAYLSSVRDYPGQMAQCRLLDAEAQARGPERAAAAREAVGERREAARLAGEEVDR